jgi:hypothetical protein
LWYPSSGEAKGGEGNTEEEEDKKEFVEIFLVFLSLRWLEPHFTA